MTLLAELAAAWVALTLVVDGLRKVPNADAFARWLRSGGLPRLANRPVVYVLAAIEVAVGVAAVLPVGRLLAAAAVALVTPVGAILVRRTGVCACRGVIRSNTPRGLVARNIGFAVLAAATVPILGGGFAIAAVLLVGTAWLSTLIARQVLLTRAPVRTVQP